MRRILVFDTGWGGELVADFLMRELGVVEVVRVIDWAHNIYSGEESLNLNRVIECLAPYAGKMDLIVLGGYTVGMALRALERVFPEQKFVAPKINYDKILRMRQYPEKVAVLMNSALQGSRVFRDLRERLPYSTLILPECMDWERLIDENLMTREIVRTELAWDFETEGETKGSRGKRGGAEASGAKGSAGSGPGLAAGLADSAAGSGSANDAAEASGAKGSAEKGFVAGAAIGAKKAAEKKALLRAIENFKAAAKEASREEERETVAAARVREEYLAHDKDRVQVRPDVVLLLNTHFWEIKTEIEQVLGWRVRVLDFREKLLHDVCAALKLRGVDGNRAK